jgi:hypothetical protein
VRSREIAGKADTGSEPPLRLYLAAKVGFTDLDSQADGQVYQNQGETPGEEGAQIEIRGNRLVEKIGYRRRSDGWSQDGNMMNNVGK